MNYKQKLKYHFQPKIKDCDNPPINITVLELFLLMKNPTKGEINEVKNHPLISIIFPAKNEGENVKNTLDSLFSVNTDYSFEVIIINDGSSDDCCDFLTTYNHANQVKLLKQMALELPAHEI